MRLLRTAQWFLLTSASCSAIFSFDFAKMGALISGLIETPQEIAVENRVDAEWQSVAATSAIVTRGEIPLSWDTAAFVSAPALRQLTSRIEGLSVENTEWSGALAGSTVTITHVEMTPSTGAMKALITLEGRSPRLGIALDVQAETIARFVGIASSGNGALAEARFKWAPLSIKPGLKWGSLSLTSKGYAAELLARTAEYLSNPQTLTFALPIQARISMPLVEAGQQTVTVPTTADESSVTFVSSIPASKVDVGFGTAFPVFTDYGVWIVGRLQSTRDVPAMPALPKVPEADLQRQVVTLKSALGPLLEKANPGAVESSVFLSAHAFEALVQALASIPAAARTLTIQVTRHQGKLAEKKIGNDLLGNLDAYADIASDDQTRATLQLDPISGTWTRVGLALSIPASGDFEASIGLHLKPPVTEGARTTVRIIGRASQTLELVATPRLVAGDDVAAVAVTTQPKCSYVPVRATTDGRLKIDFGWASVPKLGAIVNVPFPSALLGAIDVVDSRPRLVSLLPAGAPKLHFTHPTPYETLQILPTNVAMEDSGLRVDASLVFSSIPGRWTADGLSKASALVDVQAARVRTHVRELLAAATPTLDCPPPPRPELLIDGIRIGPNGEILKFLQNVLNDILKGPGDSNDVIKAGYYIGATLRQLDPADPAVRDFLGDSRAKAKQMLGEESPAYKAVDDATEEAQRVLDNPLRATEDLPRAIAEEITSMGNMPNISAQILGTIPAAIVPNPIVVHDSNGNGFQVDPSHGQITVTVPGAKFDVVPRW